MINNNLIVRSDPLDNLARVPIPEYHIPRARPARDILAVRREPDITRVPSDSVSGKAFLFDLSEGAIGRVDENLVVEGLTRHEFV